MADKGNKTDDKTGKKRALFDCPRCGARVDDLRSPVHTADTADVFGLGSGLGGFGGGPGGLDALLGVCGNCRLKEALGQK